MRRIEALQPGRGAAIVDRQHGGEEDAWRQSIGSLRVADLELDLKARTANRGGAEITLTNREFALLETLAEASPRAVSKTTLIERVWDQYFDSGTNVVNVYINYLRKKIDTEGLKPLIHTVRGVGFVLRENAP